MCNECGCGKVDEFDVHPQPGIEGKKLFLHKTNSFHMYDNEPEQEHTHNHTHSGHEHSEHEHHHHHVKHISINAPILAKNDRLAERNRGFFIAKGITVINLLSSPGSGKTSLLEQTAIDLSGTIGIGVIVGDLATENDAKRLRDKGIQAVQVTTGSACHLDAEMIARALEKLDLDKIRLLFIENVGNLVCPAIFDLGETARVAILSVTEGEDKPLKYPILFKSANVVIINKIDLAEAAAFNREKTLHNISKINPNAQIFELSAKTGFKMKKWYDYLGELCKNVG